MEKIKIKIKSTAFHGAVINLPIDGEVKIDKDGVLEVSPECADLVINNTDDYILVESTKNTSKKAGKDAKNISKVEEEETEEEDKDEDSEDGDEDEDEEEDETTFTKESLETLEIKDLVEILEAANVEPSSYEKFLKKKALLINFILKTVNK